MKVLTYLVLAAAAAPVHAQSAAQTRPLDTVRVAARAPEPALALARSTEIIGRDELARRAGHDLADVLASSLGLDVFRRSPAQADLAIRGASFNQIVILVDGIRVSDVQGGHYNMDLAVPMESIERIEILRGGGSAMYGADAIGGVVNVVTRRDGASSIAAHGGTFGTAGADIGLGQVAGPVALRVAADARRSDGHRDGTDYRAVQVRMSASSRAAGGNLSLDAGTGVRNFGAADFYGAFPSYEDTRSLTAALRYDRPLSGSWRFDASADSRRHYDLYTLDRANPAVYQNRHLSWQHGARAVANGRAGRAHLSIGTEGLNARLTSARLGNRDEQRAAGFMEASVGSASTASAMVGGRVDWSSRTGTFFSPGASAFMTVGGVTRLRASASRGYRAPTWIETYYSDPANVANPDLRSETFDMAEVGAQVTPSWGSIDVAGFVRKGEELIDWTRPAGDPAAPWRSTNLEAATFRGLEAEVGIADLARFDVRLRASGLRIASHDADTLVGKYALSPLTETASIQATTPRMFGVRLTVNGGRARRAREEAYWRTDLRATTAVRGWTFRIDGLNMTNADYRDAAGKAVAGRMLLVGLERAWLP